MYDVKTLARPWRRNKKKVAAVVILLSCFLVFSYCDLMLSTDVSDKDYVPDHKVRRIFGTRNEYDDVTFNVTTGGKYDLLVNGYMRSGTTFTGRLLSFHRDAFYWYEPMWNYHSGVYYWGPDKVCQNDMGHCRPAGKWTPTTKLHPHTMQLALENIYNCDFSTMVPAIAEGMTDIRSGESWTGYRECRKLKKTQAACAEKLQEVCKQAKHRVTKVVRLTVDILEHVLATNPKVKVIHLFRDPRAIINSRITTDWYTLPVNPGRNYSEIKRNANDLCTRMLYDYQAGLDLKRKYPNRFAFVIYEDLMENIVPRGSVLYSYIGANETFLKTNLETISLPLEGVTLLTKSTNRNFSAWWKTSLKYDVIKIIDEICSDIYKALGYKRITVNSIPFNNISTYNLKEGFLIKHINDFNLSYSDTIS